jgi:transposase
MRLDLLEGVRTLQRSGLHSSHASGITDTLIDTTMFQAVLDDVPPVRTPAGRRRARPGAVHADKGSDGQANRRYLRRRGIKPRIARRGIESSARLGRHRWKVERSLSWLSRWRRLGVRWDRDSGRWFAFVLLACARVCFNRL